MLNIVLKCKAYLNNIEHLVEESRNAKEIALRLMFEVNMRPPIGRILVDKYFINSFYFNSTEIQFIFTVSFKFLSHCVTVGWVTMSIL